MEKPMLDTLAERVDRLERENRRLKRFGLAALSSLAVVLAVGGAKLTRNADVVSAKAFILFDEQQQARAILSVDPDTGPGIGFFDADQTRRIDVRIDKGSPHITMLDPETENRAAMAEMNIVKGQPSVILSLDDRKRPQFAAAIDREGAPFVDLIDANGKERAILSLAPDGTPSFCLQDGNGKTLFQSPPRP